jgi:hypothetical protein
MGPVVIRLPVQVHLILIPAFKGIRKELVVEQK